MDKKKKILIGVGAVVAVNIIANVAAYAMMPKEDKEKMKKAKLLIEKRGQAPHKLFLDLAAQEWDMENFGSSDDF